MEFEIKGFCFKIKRSENEIKMSLKEEKDGIYIIKISVFMDGKKVPETIRIDWDFSLKDIVSGWSPADLGHNLTPEWNPKCVTSRSASWLPLQVHMNMSGRNRIAVALSDVMTPCEICSGVSEEKACIHYKLKLFTKPVSEISEYETELWIDTRNISFCDAVGAVRRWWSERYGEAYVPQHAHEPMYSTWYSMHQQLESEDLRKELMLAKDYGMKSVIVDDGWQTNDNNRGYAYCGDWEPTPKKIPDMKALVDSVHDMGMKYIMWYSVPFVGKHAKAYAEFEGMYLSHSGDTAVLDPRYPKVRRYLCKIYEDAVKNWGLDGLKLDFIDSFGLTDESSKPNPRMDFESLEDAVYALLKEVKERLEAINPEILIEFRQSYVGPVMRSCGNMLRVMDCPSDILINRAYGINLRLTSGKTAVHSDMLMWSAEDSAESAALQIINAFFCVPQVSVRIEHLPEPHKKMLKFYLDLWHKNKKCILDGELFAENPELNYTLAQTSLEKEFVAVLYAKNYLCMRKEFEKITVVNGAWTDCVILDNKCGEYKATVRIFDCMGDIVSEFKETIKRGIKAFNIPQSGVIEIKR